VAGQESSDLAVTAGSLQKLGIRLMVAPTLEEDVGEGSSRSAVRKMHVSIILS